MIIERIEKEIESRWTALTRENKRRVGIAAIVAFTLALAACGGGGSGGGQRGGTTPPPVEQPQPQPQPTPTTAAVLAGDSRLVYTREAFEAAGMLDQLQTGGDNSPTVKVLAPTNEAWDALVIELGYADRAALLADTEFIRRVVMNLIGDSSFSAYYSSSSDGTIEDEMRGGAIVRYEGVDGIEGAEVRDKLDRLAVITHELTGSDGIVQVTNIVPLPRPDALLWMSDNGYTEFAALAEAAGVTDIFTSQREEFVLFIPTDAAIAQFLVDQNMTREELLANTVFLRRLVLFHAINSYGKATVDQFPYTYDGPGFTGIGFADGFATVSTMTDGFGLSLHNENGFKVLDNISNAPPTTLATQVDAGNSYVHVIDRVLFNPQLLNE